MNSEESTGEPQHVRQMFARIATRYDFLNRLMTFGRDQSWRRRTLQGMCLQNPKRLLDVGAGTGFLSDAALKQHPESHLIACDFSPEMIAIGKARLQGQPVEWILADAHRLPFKNNCFDGVFSGFLLRNAQGVQRALEEQHRVTSKSGAMACLETTPPPKNLLEPLLRFHLQRVIPLLGRLFAGNAPAYRYLSNSTQDFLDPCSLAEKMRRAGYEKITFLRAMFGTIVILWGRKSSPSVQEYNL
jgi:demethylmenaquinone methyltransferase/2-methoxy-6-polyprenyl-1,4-benzoquinol methylase